MALIEFVDTVGKTRRKALEELLFFNPAQERLHSGIMDSVAKYGPPRVAEDGDKLTVTVEGVSETQTVYALGYMGTASHLAGMAIFARTEDDEVTVLHIAVHHEYSKDGAFSGDRLAFRLVNKVRELARGMEGVDHITMMYEKGTSFRIPV